MMRRAYTVDGGTIECHGSPMPAYDVAAKLNELTEDLAIVQRNRDFMQRQRDAARRELDELEQAHTSVKTEKNERNGASPYMPEGGVASPQDMLAALVPILKAPVVTIQYVLKGEDGLDRLRSYIGYVEDLVTLSSGARVLCLLDSNTGKRIVHDINCAEIVSIELGGTTIYKRR